MKTEKIYTDEELNKMSIEELLNLLNNCTDDLLRSRIKEVIKRKREEHKKSTSQIRPKKDKNDLDFC